MSETRLVKHTMDQYREQRACIYKQKQPPNSQCSTQDGNPHLQYASLRDVLYGMQSLSISRQIDGYCVVGVHNKGSLLTKTRT